MDAAYLLAKNLVNIRYEDLPLNVVEATKKQILDLLAVALAGYAKPGVVELLDMLTTWGGKKESSIIYSNKRLPVLHAAQMNATMAHALDFDDVNDAAVVHPGVVIIPTSMAMAERKGNVSGREFVTATALGIDMMCRLGLASKPDVPLAKSGWLFTSLYGYLGAAGTAGRILGLDEEGMVNAIGIAYHQCGGNLQTILDGGLSKRMGAGFAARGGITAALMAEKGITGAKNCLEGEFGIYRLHLRGGYDPKALTTDLGKHFEGVNVSTKPYPCCRGIHCFIDAALAIVNTHNITPKDVKEITIYTGEGHYPTLATPIETKCKPRNIVDAQFSIPWGVAVAIARRKVTVEEYTETAIKNRDILKVSGKIKVELDTGLNRSDKIEPGRVKIMTKKGDIYSEQVEDPLGSPRRPMSFDDCVKKFKDCASYSMKKLPEGRADRVIQLIGKLEKVGDVSEMMKLLT